MPELTEGPTDAGDSMDADADTAVAGHQLRFSLLCH